MGEYALAIINFESQYQPERKCGELQANKEKRDRVAAIEWLGEHR